jgi:hypothetical protein
MSSRTVIDLGASADRQNRRDYLSPALPGSLADPEPLGEHGKRVAWIKPFTKVKTPRSRVISDRLVRDGTLQRLVQLSTAICRALGKPRSCGGR